MQYIELTLDTTTRSCTLIDVGKNKVPFTSSGFVHDPTEDLFSGQFVFKFSDFLWSDLWAKLVWIQL